jgi:hypothetical protein
VTTPRGRRRRTEARRPTRARATPTVATLEARVQARTARAQARFLREFTICGNVLRSARAVKVGRRTVYDWRQDDAFRALYSEAHLDAIDALEEEARRRAVDGVLEPVYQGGEQVGRIRKYSDALLILLLKGKRPETFRERYELAGPRGGPIPLSHAGAVLLYTLHIPDNGRART